MIAVLAATILSYAVARTITRPLATITDVMREMSATGDLTRKISLSRAASWEDEDAKLLATTFNTLTDSIARFQREAAQRERLSALGRLSTVIAHEIRNPLMIIKASLRTLASERVSRDGDQAGADRRRRRGRAAQPRRQRRARFRAADPVRLRAGRCQCGVRRRGAGHASRRIRTCTSTIKPDPALQPIVTDAERLRTALVNILTNARHAVAARPASAVAQGSGPATPDIEHRDAPARPTAPFRITVRDRGIGVKPEDLPRVFDPYFTTKRTGSGLGLAIAKNIIEGMGGSIALESRPGDGTEIRIDLPARPRGERVSRRMATRGTLLLVDDEQKIRRTLGQALRAEGHDVLEAGSVREAQRVLAERSVDVLIVDNLMPDATGLDLIRELVARHAGNRAPADSDDDGARHRRERDRSDEAGRARLPAEAVRGRRAAGRRQARARAPAAAARTSAIC